MTPALFRHVLFEIVRRHSDVRYFMAGYFSRSCFTDLFSTDQDSLRQRIELKSDFPFNFSRYVFPLVFSPKEYFNQQIFEPFPIKSH